MNDFKDINFIKQQIILQEDSNQDDDNSKLLINDINDVSDILTSNEYHYHYNIDYLYREIIADENSNSNSITDYDAIIAKYSNYIDENRNKNNNNDNIDLNILIISIIDHLKYIKTSIETNNEYLIKHICLETLYKNIILKIDSFLNNFLIDSISLINLTEYSKKIDVDVEKELTMIQNDMSELKENILNTVSYDTSINIKDYPFIYKYLQ
ncbi:hypothetical protein ACO0SA_004729 [Hanseniaspora valbyensis]